MYDEFAAPHSRLIQRVVFALAAVLAFALTAVPPSPSNLRAFATTIAVAALLRAVYVLVLRPWCAFPFLSGWIFVLAFGVAVVFASERRADEVEAAGLAAARPGSVSGATRSPAVRRCLGRTLGEQDPRTRIRRLLPEPQRRRFLVLVCEGAERAAVLNENGTIGASDAEPIAAAVAADLRARKRR